MQTQSPCPCLKRQVGLPVHRVKTKVPVPPHMLTAPPSSLPGPTTLALSEALDSPYHRAFADAVPLAWNVLPLVFPKFCPPVSSSQPSSTSSEEPFFCQTLPKHVNVSFLAAPLLTFRFHKMTVSLTLVSSAPRGLCGPSSNPVTHLAPGVTGTQKELFEQRNESWAPAKNF